MKWVNVCQNYSNLSQGVKTRYCEKNKNKLWQLFVNKREMRSNGSKRKQLGKCGFKKVGVKKNGVENYGTEMGENSWMKRRRTLVFLG